MIFCMDSPTIGTIGPWHAKGYRVGLYGGSFNPIHVGHVALAKALLHEAQLDEVWFVVSPQNPLKVQQQLLGPKLTLLSLLEPTIGPSSTIGEVTRRSFATMPSVYILVEDTLSPLLLFRRMCNWPIRPCSMYVVQIYVVGYGRVNL